MRSQLVFQFMVEAFTTVAFAFLLSFFMVELILPHFNILADKKITFLLGNGLILSPYFWLASIVICIAVALIAGSYPAFYLSAFKPVKILKPGAILAGKFASMPRKALVVLQFSVSVSLIIGTIVVFRQIHFGQHINPGYERSNLLNVQLSPSGKPLDALKNDLLQSGVVVDVAQSSGPATDVLSNASGFFWKGKGSDFKENFAVIAASHSYGSTVGWQIKAGRDFSTDFPSDSAGIILNETAVKYMGLENPVGKIVRWKDGTFNDNSYRIVGVIRDMVMQSPFEPVKQTIYFMTYAPNFLYIRVNPEAGSAAALDKIRAVFNKHLPDAVFDFKFVDEQYASKFAIEKRIGNLVSFFATLAILISCLGLFALTAFTAERRTKEIGVRKVLGASVLHIWALMSKEFVLLTIIATLLSTPLAYYFLQNWLLKYQYHTTLSWWIFAIAGLGALVLTLLTVSFKTIRAALTNPVNALRSE